MSYQRAAEDVEYVSGNEVPAKTQQRLVHREKFALPNATTLVEEVSVDGGKVGLRSPSAQPCVWHDYKAMCSEEKVAACFQANSTLVNWVNRQPLAVPVS